MKINPYIITTVAVFILFHPLVAEADFILYLDDSRKKTHHGRKAGLFRL